MTALSSHQRMNGAEQLLTEKVSVSEEIMYSWKECKDSLQMPLKQLQVALKSVARSLIPSPVADCLFSYYLQTVDSIKPHRGSSHPPSSNPIVSATDAEQCSWPGNPSGHWRQESGRWFLLSFFSPITNALVPFPALKADCLQRSVPPL